MQKSESIENLAKALCRVQAEIRGYKEDSNNPFFKSKYGDLTSVWGAIREPLTKNGLSVVQTMDEPRNGNDAVTIETLLLHSSGEWISGRLEIKPDKPGCQAVGSAITYGRRYSLAAICGISPEDDDAETATDRKPSRQQKQKTAQKKADTQAKPKTNWYDSLWADLKESGIKDVDGLWKLLAKQADDIKNLDHATPPQREKFKAMVEEEIKAHKEAA